MKVIIISEWNQGNFKVGQIGEIVGFSMCSDNRPYVVVCCDFVFDYVPIYCIKKLEN